MERSCNGWIGLVLSFFLSLHALYYQSELNHIWARLGEPEEGSLVALPVTAGGPSTMPNGVAEPHTAQPPQTAPAPERRAAPDRRAPERQAQAGQAQDGQPEASQPQAARSGGVSGLRSDDGTSARNGPADGDSPGLG